MSRLRILAGDLVGALDSAARFVGAEGIIPIVWAPPRSLPWPAAIDTGVRALDPAEAASVMRRLASILDDAEPAFLRIDSLPRGTVAAGIAASVRDFAHCVIAPAFPVREVEPDLAARLAAHGLAVQLCRPGDEAPEAASLWDADDAFLDQVVAEARCLSGRVLWCGTGGLARALAGSSLVPCPELPGPILALIGSDHPASVAQLSAAWARVRRISRGDAEEAARIARLLSRDGAAAVAVTVPPGRPRSEAARRIDGCFAALLARIDAPGTLLVAGGDTMRALCTALRAARLDVDGQVMPGMPTAVLRGGSWDGLRVVVKSGAFGDAGLLVRLLG